MTTRPGGIVCPLATPLDHDERLDRAGLVQLIDRVLPYVDGIFLLGSSSEYPLLRDEVAAEVVEVAIDHIAGVVPVYIGVGDTSTARAVDRLPKAAESGANYAVALSGFYHSVPVQSALERHFLQIAESSRLPVILYNIPQNTANALTPQTVVSLAEHPNIVGIKDSSGDMISFSGFLGAQSPSFSVMQGREHLAAASMWLGADGVISALGNLTPNLLQRLAMAVRQGERVAALELQREVETVAQVFAQGHWLSALKVSLGVLGIGSGQIVSPQPALTDDQYSAVLGILKKVGLLSEAGHG